MYSTGKLYPKSTVLFLDYIPAISPAMIKQADVLLSDDVLYGMTEGALTGIPYKIFATLAGKHSVSLPVFIISSIIARAIRFVLITTISALLAKCILYRVKTNIKYGMHLIVWILFYAIYFNLYA